MIHLVARLINLFAITLRNVFAVASFVGQLIVTVVSSVVNSLLSVIINILLFFEILYEDNIFIFTEELPSFTNNVITVVSQQWDRVQGGVSELCEVVSTKINNTSVAIAWSVQAASTVIYEVLSLLKKSIVFTGKTLWFILTFIPIQLPLLIQDLFNNIKLIFLEISRIIYESLLRVCNFLVDVPLESCIGILIAVVIARLCIEFRDIIQVYVNDFYWLCVRKVLYLYYVIYNYMTDSEARTITRFANGDDVGIVHDTLEEDEDPLDPSEALCVVCQERQKCVLILPCRHVCLCRECCVRLYGYQRTCPICRTFIYHSVTIYL